MPEMKLTEQNVLGLKWQAPKEKRKGKPDDRRNSKPADPACRWHDTSRESRAGSMCSVQLNEQAPITPAANLPCRVAPRAARVASDGRRRDDVGIMTLEETARQSPRGGES